LAILGQLPWNGLVLTLLLSVSLTGLLSFMLSDEMTTGSVTSTDTHKQAFAARSHSWNIAQPRFREAFPEVGTRLCDHGRLPYSSRLVLYTIVA
jgi:hypothetical protein